MNTGYVRNEGESEEWWERFKDLIDDQSDFPSTYTFKFIAPSNELDALKALFGRQKISLRPSRKGNYTSVTAKIEMHSSDEIVAVYKAAAKIPGVVSL